jgi:hypothetical protein
MSGHKSGLSVGDVVIHYEALAFARDVFEKHMKTLQR